MIKRSCVCFTQVPLSSPDPQSLNPTTQRLLIFSPGFFPWIPFKVIKFSNYIEFVVGLGNICYNIHPCWPRVLVTPVNPLRISHQSDTMISSPVLNPAIFRSANKELTAINGCRGPTGLFDILTHCGGIKLQSALMLPAWSSNRLLTIFPADRLLISSDLSAGDHQSLAILTSKLGTSRVDPGLTS